MRLRTALGALIATVAVATSYSAFAAIAANTDSPATAQTSALAEVFLAVWDPSNGKTYVQDLGVNATTTDWSTYSHTFNLDAQFNTLFTSTAGLQYGLFAALNDESSQIFAQDYLFYGAQKGTNTSGWFSNNDTAYQAMINNISALDLLTNAHNNFSTNYAANNATTATSGAGSIGNQPGNVFNGLLSDEVARQAFTSLDQALTWFKIGLDQNTTQNPLLNVRNAFLDWTFSLADKTVSYNAVPLPAGIWLLGSALLGLVGVSRRRAPQTI